MYKIIASLLIVLAVFGCKDKSTNTESTSTTEKITNNTVATVTTEAKKIYDKILGSFVGTFGDNKITMLITKAENDSVSGRTVVGGNDRPFTGTIMYKDGKYTITAKEPGDDKNDGAFNMTIDEANVDLVQGTWAGYKTEGKQKEYVLQRKSYKYDINAGQYAKASQRLLKEADVENAMKYDLEMMRNEIFARHGYCFKKKELRQYFENEEWYVPNTVSVVDKLTEIEKKNIALIKRYEKYAEDYGDEYGR